MIWNSLADGLFERHFPNSLLFSWKTDIQWSLIRFNGCEPRVVGSSWRSFPVRPGAYESQQRLHGDGLHYKHCVNSMGTTTGGWSGGPDPPPKCGWTPNFFVAFWWGNRLRQTGYTFLIFFWRRAYYPQTKKLPPPQLWKRGCVPDE